MQSQGEVQSQPEAVIPTNSEDNEDNIERMAQLEAEVEEYKKWIATATSICERAVRGDLEGRILGAPVGTDVHRFAKLINWTLDVTDAFVREAGASLEYASQEKFFRKVVLRGLPGSFRRASELINQASSEMSKKSQLIKDAETRRLTLANQFEGSVKEIVTVVASSATEMQAVATTLVNTSKQTTDRANTVAAAAEESTSNAQGVAAATEELNQTVNEVGRQMTESQAIAQSAAQESKKTNEIVAELSSASRRIGGVIKLISQIAARTNLLALNATIEAARAGEAGRGFSVVASEVKGLAQQTASATEEIERDIKAIQDKTDEAVSAIGAIDSTINRINEISSHIGYAVEEQKNATCEIGNNIQQVALASRDVAENTTAVTQCAQETTVAVGHVNSAAEDLSKQAEGLKNAVEGFLVEIRGG